MKFSYFLYILYFVMLAFLVFLNIFLATNSFSWLTQAFFVILNILYLLVRDFHIGFALKSSSCLEHRFFLSCIPLHCSLMLNCLFFPSSSELLILLYYSSKFLPTIWFLLLSNIFVIVLCVYLILSWQNICFCICLS